MEDYRDDKGVVIEKASDSDFTEEYGDLRACGVQRLLCNKKFPTPHNNIKSSTQGIQSKIRCATSSSTTEVMRTSFLVYW